MNFLSHWSLAESKSEIFQLGSVLPDFAGMGSGRVVRIKDSSARASLPDELQELQKGIDYHYLTDVLYDELADVRNLKRRYREEIFQNYFSENRMLSLLLPSLGADLLLDGYITENSPEIPANIQNVLRLVDKIDLNDVVTNPVGLRYVFDSFLPNLPDYTDAGAVTDSIAGVAHRRLDRPLSEDDAAVVYDSMKRYKPLVDYAAPGIFSAVETALSSSR